MVKVTQLGLLFSALFLSACQMTPNAQTAPERNSNKQTTTPATKQVAKVDQVVKGSAVIDSLLKQADLQQQAGDNQLAIATLERAIRIAPRYPESYYQLAQMHYQQGNYAQSLSLAQKAISLGASGKLRKQSLTLIANCSN